ncbi:unnamed protein product [marine sediment metagenome]|uniref:Uncharacterized protein n=1 Tax=marine sediment metagenome TaxID=412755 RepID=X1M2T1_9ZZZZ
MNKAKKRYDNKWKVTRILLSDYLLLKEFSQRAGVSMAEALHKIITREDHKAPVAPTQTRLPIELIALSTPVTTAHKVKAPVALPYRPQPIIATNGHSSVAFRIKPKGVRND